MTLKVYAEDDPEMYGDERLYFPSLSIPRSSTRKGRQESDDNWRSKPRSRDQPGQPRSIVNHERADRHRDVLRIGPVVKQPSIGLSDVEGRLRPRWAKLADIGRSVDIRPQEWSRVECRVSASTICEDVTSKIRARPP
jgi:hypothetical protein